MTDGLRETRWLPERVERDPQRVALLVPGRGYTPDRPLLHFARAVLLKHGWTTQELWWPERPPPGEDEWHGWVNDHVAAALDRETAGRLLVVGKSLGTMAATTAAERALPAIWLTPLLHLPRVVDGLRRSGAPTLLVGGAEDPSWKPEIVKELGHSHLELAGADHGLETDDDPVNSAELLKQVTAAMERFVAAV